ncbi:MAG: hypothetical protein J6C77_04960, partial [Muribaculaceae bacterium]|nr:hypothetical protein [Muribaculaceae bacterium]
KLTGAISRTNTTCIFINQLREKIGQMFGPSETTTGGNALKFYASVRVDIRPSTPVKQGEETLGRHTKVKIVKNKVAPPFKRAEFDIMFGEGISRSSEILDLGVALGVIKKSGSWFSYNGSKLAQGRESAKAVLDDNPELADELEALIMEALNSAGGVKTKKSDKKPDADHSETEAMEQDSDADTSFDDDIDDDDDFSLEEDL